MANFVSKLAIVNAIARLLNLGEQGKLESFFEKAQKSLKDDIKASNEELRVREFDFERNLDKLEDELADAKQAYDEVYLNVNMDSIQTKTDQANYVKVYFKQIKEKKDIVQQVESKISHLKEKFEKEKENLLKEIKLHEDNLEKISASSK